MNVEFAHYLCELNNRFYAEHANSFSATRQNAWTGWQRCLQETGLNTNTPTSHQTPVHVLDVGCGNLRFEEFLAKELPGIPLSIDALDSCANLIPPTCAGQPVCPVESAWPQNAPGATKALASAATSAQSRNAVTFYTCDVMHHLQHNTWPKLCTVATPYHLLVAFGFLHHIPLPAWRKQLLMGMIACTKPNGLICISLWRFLSSATLATKARTAHAEALRELRLEHHAAEFEEGDFLLGWRNTAGAWRYCHSFSDEEIDELIQSVSSQASLQARFRADGRTGALNEYLVFQKR